MCGIAGIVSANGPVNQDLFDALTVLQHRGQDAAGILTNDGSKLYLHKDLGLVRDVFQRDEQMAALPGRMGIAHVRYPTAGGASCDEVQPFYAGREKGDSTSLQRECSARARFETSTHASRALREMIARPKNQPKRAENDRDRSL